MKSMKVREFFQKQSVGYLASVAGVMFVALVFWPFYHDVHGITAASALLTVVLLIAINWGMGPALVSSILGAIYLNIFFVPPLYKFQPRLAEGDDLVSLVAFLVTSILVGQLFSRAQRHARESRELYDRLRATFDQASQLEAIQRSERLKSALLNSVTHDLRTPLTSIKASATALMDVRNNSATAVDLSDVRVGELLGSIVEQSDRLNHFIEGMIELAQVEAGGSNESLKSEPIPMEEVVGIALTRAEDVLRNHQIVVKCEEGLNAAVNPRAVSQVIFSLLENAGRYAPSDTVVEIVVAPQDPELIRVVVEDEGPGVPKPLHDRIFDKFYRGADIRNRNGSATGLGLGLAIARGIVEAHGGRIWVEGRNSGESGARFVFTLPAARDAKLIQPDAERIVSR